jgi:hypothetical protein
MRMLLMRRQKLRLRLLLQLMQLMQRLLNHHLM